MTQHANRGKKFAEEFSASLNRLKKDSGDRLWHHSFDNVGHYQGPKRPADRVVLYRGFGWLIELKEVHKDTVAFSAVQPHQEAALGLARSSENGSLVIVKHVLRGGSRAFAWTWGQWELLRALPKAKKSISLLDGHRPICVEIDRYTEGEKNTRWHLGPMFEEFLSNG